MCGRPQPAAHQRLSPLAAAPGRSPPSDRPWWPVVEVGRGRAMSKHRRSGRGRSVGKVRPRVRRPAPLDLRSRGGIVEISAKKAFRRRVEPGRAPAPGECRSGGTKSPTGRLDRDRRGRSKRLPPWWRNRLRDFEVGVFGHGEDCLDSPNLRLRDPKRLASSGGRMRPDAAIADPVSDRRLRAPDRRGSLMRG